MHLYLKPANVKKRTVIQTNTDFEQVPTLYGLLLNGLFCFIIVFQISKCQPVINSAKSADMSLFHISRLAHAFS